MIRKILKADNPKLRQVSRPVKKIDKKIHQLIADLKETLLAQKEPEGVGLAAPQIGKLWRVFVMKPEDKILVVINPKIISISKRAKSSSKEENILEGCLSLPHYYGELERPQKVKIKYLQENGLETTQTFKGFAARIVLHEIDHLNGKIFIDKVLKQKGALYKDEGKHLERVELI